ncbi:MAG TPA: sigma-54-dependent Fis family transcriptional regulator [Planctomycetes bacterium]|nr:sigma-54-dependent Fis family transcriptional regulator [Planctomycetota bacterium]
MDPSFTPESWGVIEHVFRSLGRVLLVLDKDLTIVQASEVLNELVCPTACQKAQGLPVTDLIQSEVFEDPAHLDELLQEGPEEGRRAVLRCMDGTSRLVSLTFSRFPEGLEELGIRGAYLVVLRPAERDNRILQYALSSFGLVANSPAILKIIRLISSIHRSDATVLITGESGVGKEIVARAIHDHSVRRNEPFVVVNCAALPPDLLESELFGHVKGAFTGAVQDRVGRFEAAGKGTVFLDEIGDMPLHLQVKLLRVLQERTFERVGESRSRPMEGRILAATNVDLAKAIQEGKFRDDLFYRLRVVPIHIPPLRERPEDIEPLVRHLLVKIAAREGRVVRVATEVFRELKRYPWPGNVRELENALEYAVALSKGTILFLEDFPPEIREPHKQDQPLPKASKEPAPQEGEMARLLRVLEENHWRREPAAKALGISRTTLWRKMRELGIDD